MHTTRLLLLWFIQQVLLNHPCANLLALVITYLAYLSMLFIQVLASAAVSSKINSMLKQSIFGMRQIIQLIIEIHVIAIIILKEDVTTCVAVTQILIKQGISCLLR